MAKSNYKKNEIFNYIKLKIENEHITPTIREICDNVGLSSSSSVFNHLKSLEKEGKIIMEKGKSRSIRLVNDISNNFISVPLVGNITAGLPILAVENITDYIPYPIDKVGNKELFALNVIGESMINAGILDGDIIIAERTPYAENGDIIVALIGDEATVKTFYKEKDRFRLQPENDSFSPIYTKELVVLGKVCANFRFY